jgi:glycosyltransferase involved in cell wall biosynthesis
VVSQRARVSVVTIFRDAELYLGETIDSVIKQTFPTWELILVDDGSIDGSAAIARHAAKLLPQQVSFCAHANNENHGMSRSRNLGASKADAEFITFLDADDTWPPEKLAEQVAILDANPTASMVYGRAKAWFSWNPDDSRNDHYWDLGVTPNQVVHPPLLFRLLMQNKVQTPMSGNAMMRRKVFDQLGGFEEAFTGLYEDAVLFAKLHLNHSTYVADRTWLHYRQHFDRGTATERRGDYAAKRLMLLEWLGAYLDSAAFPVDVAARRAFEQELWNCRHPYFSLLLARLGIPRP